MKRFQSEFILNKNNKQHHTALVIDECMNELNLIRSNIKDEIRLHRIRIKEEGEEHEQYGIEIENRITKLLSEANLSRQTLITNKNKSK